MTDKISLLLELEETDYTSAFRDIQLASEGTHFFYAIDFYDLSEYCFPFGLREDSESRKKSLLYAADEQYCFYQIFNPSEAFFKVILMDEYVQEVLEVKRYLRFSLENGLRLINTLTEYQRRSEQYPGLLALQEQQEHQIKDTLDTKLSLILSITLDILNEGIAKLMNLFKERQIILRHEDLTSMSEIQLKEREILSHAFNTFQDDEDSEKIVMNFIGHSKTKQRDARAICRIMSINKYLEQKFKDGELSNRCIILYLSSTESSKNLFKHSSILKMLPKIEGQSYNFQRSIPQTFLLHLCNTSHEVSEINENILYLKQRILEIKRYQDKLFDPAKEIKSVLLNRFNRYREYFENDAILNRYTSFADKIMEVKERIENGKVHNSLGDKLLPLLNNIIERGQRNITRAIRNLVSLENWTIQTQTILLTEKLIKHFNNENARIKIKTGDDSIRSVIHHLPIVYFTPSPIVKEVMRLMTQIIIDKKADSSLAQLNKIILSLFSKSFDIGVTLEGKLMQAFLLLIMPDELMEGINTNEMAYRWAIDLLKKEILQNTSTNDDSQRSIEADYRFFSAWAARRAKRYDESLEILLESKEKFPYDARFYHGLSLTLYCILVAKGKQLNNRRLLLDSIEYAGRALDLYKEEDYIIRKTKLALLNSMSFLYIELHLLEHPEHTRYLDLADQYNQSLKAHEPDYHYFPEYLHTESLLRFCQAMQLFETRREPDTIKQVLESSVNLIYEAISIIQNNDSAPNSLSLPKYEAHKQLVEDKLNSF